MSEALKSRRQTKVLHPGDVALAERGARLETLLGSCVAIVLTDPRRTVGVMCHIVHSQVSPARTSKSTAYAEVALDHMYALLLERGIDPRQCEAYVYGGGNMFPELFPRVHVGERNARWVLDALEHDGVAVLHQDVCGNIYRRLSWVVGPQAPTVVAVEI